MPLMQTPKSSPWVLSTAAAAKGGKLVLSDFVGVGDQVTVTYRKSASGLHAEEVRVRAKGKK